MSALVSLLVPLHVKGPNFTSHGRVSYYASVDVYVVISSP